MTPNQISALIDQRIRNHELRVALISAPLGLAILAGLFHAIWLLNHTAT